jgi:sugar phosphate permease
MKNSHNKGSIHYGWYIVAAGTLCIFAGLGFGRFALGMLLPSMSTSLGLSYSQMGLLSTINFIGYLVAVLLCGYLVNRLGYRLIIFLALLLVGGSMILISRAEHFATAAFLYFLTGMGSGASNVPMMALVPTWFASSLRGRAAGFIVIGSGFAILLSGKLIPYINSLNSTEGWRTSWFFMGITVVVISFFCLLVIRNSPVDIGLRQAGRLSDTAHSPTTAPIAHHRSIPAGTILHLGAIYFLFGSTYVIYVTFIVTTLVQERNFSEVVAGQFWSWIGFLSLFSGPVFGTLSDKLGRKAGLMIVFTIQMCAYLLIAVNLPGAYLYLSIGCFGIVAWSIPSIMAALVGDYVGAEKTARIFGIITFIFALGQIAGPYAAGVLAEKFDGFSISFLLAALMAGSAVVLCWLLHDPRKHHSGLSPISPPPHPFNS